MMAQGGGARPNLPPNQQSNIPGMQAALGAAAMPVSPSLLTKLDNDLQVLEARLTGPDPSPVRNAGC